MHIVKYIVCTLYTILRFISLKYIGTDFEPKTKAKSDSFGENQGWPYLNYLLHPRSTGFIHCVNECAKGNLGMMIVI